jgi:hypothetical protein
LRSVVKPASSISALAARAEELVLSDAHLGVGLVELDLARRIEMERGPVEPGSPRLIPASLQEGILESKPESRVNHSVNSA